MFKTSLKIVVKKKLAERTNFTNSIKILCLYQKTNKVCNKDKSVLEIVIS